VALASPLSAQVTSRASVASGGTQGNLESDLPAISADGRFVAFQSLASDLVAADTNGVYDIFVRDRQSGTTRRMSLSSNGEQAVLDCEAPSISGDGRYVAFHSKSSNLVPGDTNGWEDIFVRDRVNGTTELVSVNSAGVQGDYGSFTPSVSADGRFVAFCSYSGNLAGNDWNGYADVFVRDCLAGTTERVSISTSGAQANGHCQYPSISADGRYVVFWSYSSTLIGGVPVLGQHIYVRDRLLGTTERVSLATDGTLGDNESDQPSISGEGRYVAFRSRSSNLVPGDTNGYADVFVRDRQQGTTERVSINSGEAEGEYPSATPGISGDGRYVVFQSKAQILVPGDINVVEDIFLRDRQLGTTQRVSLDSVGAQGNGHCSAPVISSDGRWLAFLSTATNLVPGDTNGAQDVFVRDGDATAFSSLCDPGVAGYASCPCSNPPGGPTRGCDNSASTGGATLSASGVAHLSADTLVFMTTGEKPIALSIVLQGNAWVQFGVVYGQGTRCVGGSLKRLYAKSAVGGSITAPDFGAGESSVSAQSAAKGDPIQPGQPRWYTVYYRDPIVLGGCPSTSTFNATQTGQVNWSP